MAELSDLLSGLFPTSAAASTAPAAPGVQNSGVQALNNSVAQGNVLARLRAPTQATPGLPMGGSISGLKTNGSKFGAFAQGIGAGLDERAKQAAAQQALMLQMLKMQWDYEHTKNEEKRNAANDAFTQKHTTRSDDLNEKKTTAEIARLGVPANFVPDPNNPGQFVPQPGGPADPTYLKQAAEAKAAENKPKVVQGNDASGNHVTAIATPDENAPGGIKLTPVTLPPVPGKFSPKEQAAITESDKSIQTLQNAKSAYEWMLGVHTDASKPTPADVTPDSPNAQAYGGIGAGAKTTYSANAPSWAPGADPNAAATTTELDKRMTEQAAAQLKDYFGSRPAFAADQKLFSITPSSGMTPQQRATVAAVQLDKVNRYLNYETARRQALSNHHYFDGTGFNANDAMSTGNMNPQPAQGADGAAQPSSATTAAVPDAAAPAAASAWRPYTAKDGSTKYWNGSTGEVSATPPAAQPTAKPDATSPPPSPDGSQAPAATPGNDPSGNAAARFGLNDPTLSKALSDPNAAPADKQAAAAELDRRQKAFADWQAQQPASGAAPAAPASADDEDEAPAPAPSAPATAPAQAPAASPTVGAATPAAPALPGKRADNSDPLALLASILGGAPAAA